MRVEGQCTAGGPMSGQGVPLPKGPVPHAAPLEGHRFVGVPRKTHTYPAPVEALPAPVAPYQPSGPAPKNADVRAWAIRTGRMTATRGPIPESIRTAYLQENR